MRGLKILVMIMGVMLVVGFAVLLAAIAGRIPRGSHTPGAARQLLAAIEIPRGARIEAMTAGTDRLVLGLVLPDGGRELLIIDLATGARLGAIDLRPTP
jgi:hypothetical protein